MNELLEAARSSEDSSEERYESLKKENAGTEMSPAEQRYEKLKEEAKNDFLGDDEEEEAADGEENSDSGDFITH